MSKIEKIKAVLAAGSLTIVEAHEYMFHLTDDAKGFHLKFSKQGDALCGTMYQLAKSLNDSLGEKAYPKRGDIFRVFAEMCDQVDALDKGEE